MSGSGNRRTAGGEPYDVEGVKLTEMYVGSRESGEGKKWMIG